MRRLAFAATAALILAAPAAATNLIVNGSFETGDFTGWSLDFVDPTDSGSMFVTDTVFTGYPVGDVAPTDGTYHAALGNFLLSSITQYVPTIAGATYRFSFDLANLDGPENIIGIAFDQPFLVLENSEAFPYTSFEFLLKASSNSTLMGFSAAYPREFWLLDNVSVTYVSGPIDPPPPGGVPEPASWALLIAGFGIVGAGLRRRRAVAA